LEAEVRFLGDDDVVEDAEAEKLGGFGQLVVSAAVGFAGLRVAVGMVVGEDDGGGAISYHVGEDFARVDGRLIEQADSDDALFDDFVCAVAGIGLPALDRRLPKPENLC
jgi:hypothetical protein